AVRRSSHGAADPIVLLPAAPGGTLHSVAAPGNTVPEGSGAACLERSSAGAADHGILQGDWTGEVRPENRLPFHQRLQSAAAGLPSGLQCEMLDPDALRGLREV